MTAVYHSLSASNFFQDWSNTSLISASDNWSGVPSIQGFRGDSLTALTGADPQTLLADDAPGVLDVNANQTNPNTFSTGGVTEFEIANPTIALAGSGTADAPYIVLYLDATGRSNVNLSFNARDIDGSGDDATQQIAVHYRIGESGSWINLPAGYLADASTGPNLADASTPVSFSLPTEVNGQAQVQVRIMTTNAAGNDEWIGIDDISVTSQAASGGPTMSIAPLDADRVEGDSGSSAFAFTVSRTDSTGAASVNYSVAGAGADPAAAADFAGNILPSGTVNFVDGQSSVTLTILVAGDAVSETNEGFQVTLQLPSSGYTLASATANGVIRNDDPIAIYTIQGAGHISSFNGQTVTTEGVVTALSFNGYYIQDATGDGNDATSDGIFVFTGSAPPATLTVGETVRLTGTVTEFQPNGNANNLRLTELTNPTILSESNNVTAIAPVVIGAGGRQPSQTVIDNDAFTVFDPAQDAIDFWESLEGMLVTVPSPVAIGGTSQFASGSFFNEEIWVVPQGAFDASSQNARGGLTIEPDDFNPERIQIDDMDRVLEFPQVTTGDRLSDITGVVNYDFGNFEILVSTAPTVITPSNLARETTTLVADSREITIAGYNVENLDANDSDGDTDIANGKFAAIAAQITNNLAGPMVVALQEVQDSSGSQNNGVTDADLTASTLIAAISAAGGPAYTYADTAPVNNTSGGQPGGNIRTGFLYNAAEVTLVRMEQITDPTPAEADAYAGDDFDGSRLPLVGFFERNGVEFIVINVHLNSKGGDGGLFGDDQPPVLTSELQRNEQARVIRDYIQGLLATDPAANIMLIGDVNDFSWSLPGQTLLSSPMTDLADHLIADPVERYSFNFQGNAQELDHTMVSDSLRDNFVAAFDIVHVNSEFSASDRASDHDPGVTLIDFRNASETLLAAAGGEFIDGAGGNDFITGQGGNDTFNGGAGNDTLVGGGGNDFFVASQGNDSVDGGAGANDALDAFLAASGVTFDFASMSGGLTAGNVSGIERFLGSLHADQITGSSGNDLVNGRDGDDTIEGGAGDDWMSGGAGIDTASYAGAGAGVRAYLDLTTRQQTGGAGLDGLFDFENLIGSNFDDSLRGSSGANDIRGGAGNDLILVTAGSDTIDGGAGGFDTYDAFLATGGVSFDFATMTGAMGVHAVSNLERFYGSNFNDTITGTAGADVIGARAGDDTVSGGGGRDWLDGGLGNDLISGGAGNDIFQFLTAGFAAGNLDVISDFGTTAGSDDDTLRLQGNAGNYGFADIAGGVRVTHLASGSTIDVMNGSLTAVSLAAETVYTV